MRSATKVESEVDVLGEVGFNSLPRKISGRRGSARSEDEIDACQRDDDNEDCPDPQTVVLHLLLALFSLFSDDGAFSYLEERFLRALDDVARVLDLLDLTDYPAIRDDLIVDL